VALRRSVPVTDLLVTDLLMRDHRFCSFSNRFSSSPKFSTTAIRVEAAS
jgi:hypothetical protein